MDQLREDFDVDDRLIEGDPDHLESALQNLVRFKSPVIRERFHQMAHHGSFHLKMQIGDGVFRVKRRVMTLADVEAAGESDLSIGYNGNAVLI